MKKLALLVIVVAGFLGGCAGTLKTRDIDATSKRFPTDTVLAEGGVKTVKPFEAKYKKLAYLKIDDNKNTQYNDFFVKTIEKIGAFDRVAQKSDLESLVIERKLTDRISNVSDLIVSADVKLTHCAGVKVTHLGDDDGLLAVDVDPGASSGDTCDGPQGRGDQRDREAAWLLAQYRAAVLA